MQVVACHQGQRRWQSRRQPAPACGAFSSIRARVAAGPASRPEGNTSTAVRLCCWVLRSYDAEVEKVRDQVLLGGLTYHPGPSQAVVAYAEAL